MCGTNQGNGVTVGPGDTNPGIGQMETLSMAGPGDGDPGFGPSDQGTGVMAGPNTKPGGITGGSSQPG